MNLRNGQSLIEVIVAVGMIMLLTTGLIAGTTAAIKAGRFGSVKSPAGKYAQEGIETARKLRDESWSSFDAMKSGATNGKWCLGDDLAFVDAKESPEVSCLGNLNTTYTRYLTFTWIGAENAMQVTSTVTWIDGSTMKKSELITKFTNWKQQ